MSISRPGRNLGQRSLLLAAGVAVLATLACQFSLGSPQRPGPPIQPSQTAVESLKQSWSDSITSSGSSGQVELKADEVQLTSLLALQFQQRADLGISDPQVYLEPNTISMYATVDRGWVKGDVLLNIDPQVTPDGSMDFRVVSAKVGFLPIPKPLTDQLSSAVNQGFTEMLGAVATGIKVDSVTVTADQLTLSGSFR